MAVSCASSEKRVKCSFNRCKNDASEWLYLCGLKWIPYCGIHASAIKYFLNWGAWNPPNQPFEEFKGVVKNGGRVARVEEKV